MMIDLMDRYSRMLSFFFFFFFASSFLLLWHGCLRWLLVFGFWFLICRFVTVAVACYRGHDFDFFILQGAC
jgi:uncharacterized membrane protein YjjP (DUF1212 family)